MINNRVQWFKEITATTHMATPCDQYGNTWRHLVINMKTCFFGTTILYQVCES